MKHRFCKKCFFKQSFVLMIFRYTYTHASLRRRDKGSTLAMKYEAVTEII